MKIAVMGAGGVGGYFGARLAAGGQDVHFIARGAHLQAIRQQGLRVRSPLGDLHLAHAAATDDPAQVGEVDIVLLGVKLWDTGSAARRLAPMIGRDTLVISFQNGVTKDEILRDVVGAEHVAGGVCYIAATIAEPGVIQHANTLQKLVFGAYGAAGSPKLQAFLRACEAAGIEARISEDIAREIWEKFVFLVGLSATTTALRQPIGCVRSGSASRALLLAVMSEASAVGRARGVALSPGFAEDRLAFCDTLPEGMSSSMHHDLQHGHRLELDWLSGEVVRRGRALGVATPFNQAVCAVLEPYAQGRRAASHG
jgi:2-dehydropantoate 2-reductase